MPERVRADALALVLAEEVALGTLAGEDGEVILPEVDHHFLELTIAHHGARDLRGLQLGEELPREAPRLLDAHRVGGREIEPRELSGAAVARDHLATRAISRRFSRISC